MASLKSAIAQLSSDARSDAEEAATPAPPPARTPMSAPGLLIGNTKAMQEKQAEIARLKEQEGAPVELALDLLDDGPYHPWPVDPKAVDELVANLMENELVTPIIVRKMGNRYQIIAGRTRVAAFKKLGRPTIKAIIRVLDDTQTALGVFFDNFKAPSLADYQKYLGFVHVRTVLSEQSQAPITQEMLAKQAGVSQTTVSYLLSFSDLPQAAHAILKGNPSLLSAKIAAQLAPLVSSYADKVEQAIKQIEDGSLKAASAREWVLGTGKSPDRPIPKVIKAGRAKFADVSRRQNRITVDLSALANPESVESEIISLITNLASKSKA